jgi:hypothetical protein
MRLTNLQNIYNSLPIEIKAGLRQVNKLTSIGNQLSAINTSQDTLFLLSEVEVFGTTSFSKSGEGTQYEYYAKGASSIKKVGSSASIWWLRSPYGSGAAQFCTVIANGSSNYTNVTGLNGVAPAFCF